MKLFKLSLVFVLSEKKLIPKVFCNIHGGQNSEYIIYHKFGLRYIRSPSVLGEEYIMFSYFTQIYQCIFHEAKRCISVVFVCFVYSHMEPKGCNFLVKERKKMLVCIKLCFYLTKRNMTYGIKKILEIFYYFGRIMKYVFMENRRKKSWKYVSVL